MVAGEGDSGDNHRIGRPYPGGCLEAVCLKNGRIQYQDEAQAPLESAPD
jgi:hypothetical protein